MSDDEQRQVAATTGDLSRQAGTSNDGEYSLSVDDALALYEEAGLSRTPRSIQRYCANGDLACHRVETPIGSRFLITPMSIERHIAYIREVQVGATSRDPSRRVADPVHSLADP